MLFKAVYSAEIAKEIEQIEKFILSAGTVSSCYGDGGGTIKMESGGRRKTR